MRVKQDISGAGRDGGGGGKLQFSAGTPPEDSMV